MGILRVPFKTWIVSIIMGFISSCGRVIPVSSTHGEPSIFAKQDQTSFGPKISEIKIKGVIAPREPLPKKPNTTKRSFRKSSGSSTNSLDRFQFPLSFQTHAFIVVPESKSKLIDSVYLSANGAVMNMGAVLWIDSFRAARFVESTATDLTWLWIILLAVGGIGFILAGLGVSGKLPKWPKAFPPSGSHSTEQSPAVLPINNKYCPQCGTASPLQAGFCTKCGAQFPSQ